MSITLHIPQLVITVLSWATLALVILLIITWTKRLALHRISEVKALSKMYLWLLFTNDFKDEMVRNLFDRYIRNLMNRDDEAKLVYDLKNILDKVIKSNEL
jgi:hypothetical protein